MIELYLKTIIISFLYKRYKFTFLKTKSIGEDPVLEGFNLEDEMVNTN